METIVQTGAESVETQERDQPSPGEEQALVRVHAAGICGSDAHAYKRMAGFRDAPIPRIMGHEYVGEVVETGSDVGHVEVGDSVVEEPVSSCGSCFQCRNGQSNVCQNAAVTGVHRDGAYATHVTANEDRLFRVTDDVSVTEAALVEPTSIAARAVLTRSNVEPKDTVLVEGPGPIGSLVAMTARTRGADVVVSGVERDAAHRLPLLQDLGIETVNVDEDDVDEIVRSYTDGIGFDVVFDATGHETGLELAVDFVRKGGQIVPIGLPGEPSEILLTDLIRGEIDVTISYGSKWSDFENALHLVREDINAAELATHVDVSKPNEAFEAFLDRELCKPLFDFAER